MQQRGLNTSMEVEPEPETSTPQSRGRTNSKLKVLVRSHAMREEASPPRDPPNAPCIKLIPSSNSSPNQMCLASISKPVVVLSPSISRGNSPCRSPLHISPTSTLVASPVCRSSPQSVTSHLEENVDMTKVLCNHVADTVEVDCEEVQTDFDTIDKLGMCEGCTLSKTIEETSHRKNLRNDRNMCDCTNQACTKCYKNDRNINNNLSSNINNNVVSSSNTLTVNRATRGKLRQQSSSQGSFEGSSSNSPCLSRDSSSEQYTDTTGVDLEQFIAETLNRNAKDRALMLRIEQELVSLAKDKIKSHYKFPPMSSYQRMLVHRCAAYFGMDHNIESSGKCVVVNKTKCTRIPDIAFKEYVKEDIVFVEEPRRSILKRDSNSIEDYGFKSPDRQFSLENRRSKSFEEREEEYERARRRIFNRDIHEYNSTEEFGWAEIPWSSTDSDNSTRFRLLHTEKSGPRLLKVQSVETSSDMPRPCVAKSYSFGGYGGVSVLTRGDSVLSTHSAGPRLLTKQDSGASTVSWRLSPSSSGYKSQSQISESITPSPTSTPNLPSDCNRQDSTNSNTSASTSDMQTSVTEKDIGEPQLVWAVTDIHNVPKGSIIINPQTGKPVKNIDGSIYHYDPSDPPPGFNSHGNGITSKSLQSPHKSASPQKLSKECLAMSPKKQRSRSSPSLNKKSNLINSATSPSLPFTPSLQHSRSMQITPNADSMSNLPTSPYQPPIYGNNFGNISAPDSSLQMYHQQPYIVYASYGVPVPSQFDGRIETSMPDVPGGYYLTESGNSSVSQPIPYQATSSYWHQQPITLYQNPPNSNPPPPPAPQRFAVPAHAQTGSYIPSSFSSSYCQPPLPPPSQVPQNVSQNSQNAELVPVYSQPVQIVYSTQQHTPQNSVLYPGHHGVMYAQTPIYPNMMVPVQNVQYPQNPPTPSNTAVFAGSISDQNVQVQQNFSQLTNNMNQLNINQQGTGPTLAMNQSIPISPHIHQQFEIRNVKNCALKGNKFSTPKNFVSGSSQSSTGTSSPATTVVANYCSNSTTACYRTPPETPPTQNVAFGYGPNFLPSAVIRQMSNVRASPPVNRNSRSPTPASDISHVDRHRFSLPPTLYQGMPYVFQNDSRMIQGRGQAVTCRQQAPMRQHGLVSHNGENVNKNNKNRKSRGNKMLGLPPSGK